MFRDDIHNRHSDSRSASPSVMRRPVPTSPHEPPYSGFGGIRHGFKPGSNYGSTFGGPNQACRLPPIMGAARHYFRGFEDRAVRSQTTDPSTLVNDIDMSSSGREDTDMTMLDPLQRPGHLDGGPPIGRIATPQAHNCFCKQDEKSRPSLSPIKDAIAACNDDRPYARLCVDAILNQSPPPGTQAHNGESSTAANPSSRVNNGHPMLTPPRSLKSFSSISSGSTQRPPFSVTEERCFLLNTLYHICMVATKNYISNLPPATRSRHNQLPRHRYHGSTRYQPYVAPRGGRFAHTAADSYHRRRTLMDNISDISTHIWRRARSDEMAPHRAEGDTVHAMRELYRWGGTVVRGVESDGANREDGDVEGPFEVEGMRAALAAKNLCQWLGNDQACEECRGLMSELRDLTAAHAQAGAAGLRIMEVDDESLDGNIT